MLADYQTAFIEFAIQHDVLQFGEFELKSGRNSHYFFNAGLFNTGQALGQLGQFYANALIDSRLEFDLLFGPAYKGIPLVCSTTIALASRHKTIVPYVFNRKEAKTHGEGGTLVGAALEGNVVIVDDVITAGTAIREVMGLVAESRATPAGILVAIDRQERGQGKLSAIQEVERDFGVRVVSVVNLGHIVEYLHSSATYTTELKLIERYRNQYGIEL